MSSRPNRDSVPPPPPVRFSVTAPDAVSIAVDFYQGAGQRVILIVPGFWRVRDHPVLVDLARKAVQHGFSAAVMDLRGHGDSEGVFTFNRVEFADVQAVGRFLTGASGASRLDLVGFSLGGSIVAAAAARGSDLPLGRLLLISPVADFKRIRPHPNPFTIHRHLALAQALRRPRFEWSFMRSEKLRAVDEIRQVRIPVSILHVKNDWLISHEHAQQLYDSAGGEKELHILDVPGHWHADRALTEAAGGCEPVIERFFLK